MIRIAHQRRPFPRTVADNDTGNNSANSWKSQWQHLPRRTLQVVRVGRALRVMPIG